MMKRITWLLIFASILILLVATVSMVMTAITLSKISNTTPLKFDPTVTTPVSLTGSTPPLTDLNWWKYTPIYQVYPRSFQDSNGDGTGDLQGIKRRVSYLYELGIKAIWLSPIYDSPMADFGYDIRNYTEIAPVFGTMDDFEELVDELHKYGMYLIMDFVPNHSSNQHDWFNRSVNGEMPYKDYYVWRDKPNNWISVFGNSSWTYVDRRKQYYLHQFLMEQPDLNYRNPELRRAMLDVLTTWIDRGVDGFRIDAIIFLIEDSQFRDEVRSGENVPPNHYGYLMHNYTTDLDETYDVVHEWTKMLKAYGEAHNKHIFTCTEGYSSMVKVMRYYTMGVDFPFNFNLVPLNGSTKASSLRKMIYGWMDRMPAGAWPNWVLGNHDNHRIASRLGGRHYVDIANMLLLLLPGTPTCYYGDEIGMVDANISFRDSVDPAGTNWGPDAYMNFSRDPERTPMQWSKQKNAGFSIANRTWLPLGPQWQTYNVEEEMKDPNSHLSIFKSLIKLRQEPAFRSATNLRMLDVDDERVFVFTREIIEERYLIILNFGHDGERSIIQSGLAFGKGKVVIKSRYADLSINDTIDFTQPFTISNAHGYVVKLID